MNHDELVGLLDPQQLQLIILPTEECNFRCTYCYEDFAIGRMSRATIDAVKKLIALRITKLHRLSISWFGGEPLIAKDIVTEITAFAQEAAARAKVRFDSDMTTNAYGLGHAAFLSLLNLGVRAYQVSLDGDEGEHDKTRKLRSGKGSFQRIWANLCQIRETAGDYTILLRIHVHADNWQSVQVLLTRINEEFGTDQRFNLVLKEVGNWGGDSVRQMTLIKNTSGPMGVLRAHLDSLGWYSARLPINTEPVDADQSPDGSQADAPSVRAAALTLNPVPQYSGACYAALPNSFVIRADGNLSKCTVAFSDPRNMVGKINNDGSLTIDNSKMQNFMRGFKSLDATQLHCPIKNMSTAPQLHPLIFHPQSTTAAII